MQGIILCGGLGTRLRDAVPGLPKPMFPIGTRPFLALLLEYLEQQGFARLVLSVGHLHHRISDYFGARLGAVELVYSVEEQLLGTGGAIRHSMSLTEPGADVFVLNGDTFLEMDYAAMRAARRDAGTCLAVALHATDDVARFGKVTIAAGRMVAMEEKGGTGAGLINAGVYLLDRALLDAYDLPTVFSFEHDFLAPQLGELRPAAYVSDAYFIDIGTPESYRQAQAELVARFGG
jgi:D-glycero-alpha-D-manno-heptose 1-phosphate guanylyltransferase